MVRAHRSVTKWCRCRYTALTFIDIRTCSGNAEQNNRDHINFFPTDRLINFTRPKCIVVMCTNKDFSLRATFKDILCGIAC